jgi:hypothetical protein
MCALFIIIHSFHSFAYMLLPITCHSPIHHPPIHPSTYYAFQRIPLLPSIWLCFIPLNVSFHCIALLLLSFRSWYRLAVVPFPSYPSIIPSHLPNLPCCILMWLIVSSVHLTYPHFIYLDLSRFALFAHYKLHSLGKKKKNVITRDHK